MSIKAQTFILTMLTHDFKDTYRLFYHFIADTEAGLKLMSNFH